MDPSGLCVEPGSPCRRPGVGTIWFDWSTEGEARAWGEGAKVKEWSLRPPKGPKGHDLKQKEIIKMALLTKLGHVMRKNYSLICSQRKTLCRNHQFTAGGCLWFGCSWLGVTKRRHWGGGVRLRHATSRPPPADPNTKTVSGGGGPARCSGGRVPLRGTARPSPTGSPRLRRGGRGPGPAGSGPQPSDHQSGTVGPHPRGDRQAEAVVGKRAPTNSVGDHRRRNSRTARCSGAA